MVEVDGGIDLEVVIPRRTIRDVAVRDGMGTSSSAICEIIVEEVPVAFSYDVACYSPFCDGHERKKLTRGS